MKKTDWQGVAIRLHEQIADYLELSPARWGPYDAIVLEYTSDVEPEPEAPESDRIADALEAMVEHNKTDASAFAGLIHADLETLMFAILAIIPPLILSMPNLHEHTKAHWMEREKRGNHMKTEVTVDDVTDLIKQAIDHRTKEIIEDEISGVARRVGDRLRQEVASISLQVVGYYDIIKQGQNVVIKVRAGDAPP